MALRRGIIKVWGYNRKLMYQKIVKLYVLHLKKLVDDSSFVGKGMKWQDVNQYNEKKENSKKLLEPR